MGPATTLEAGQGASLEFKNALAPKSSIWSLRFSRAKCGSLSVLSNTGHLKNYDIAKEYLSEEYRSSMDETLGQGSFKNYPEQVYTKYVRDVCSPYNHPSRGCRESERVVSFDSLSKATSNDATAVTLSGNGKVSIVTLQPPAPPVRISPQGVLVQGRADADTDFRTIGPSATANTPVSEVVTKIRDRVFSGSAEQHGVKTRDGTTAEHVSSREARERASALGEPGSLLTAEEALTLLTVSMRRCKEGYLFDSVRNRKILADDPYLQDFWNSIERKQTTTNIYQTKRY